MFSPQRIGRVFLSLLVLNCLIFAACSKQKSNLDESELNESDENCLNSAQGCSLQQFGSGSGSGTSAGTATGTSTGTASGSSTGTGTGINQSWLDSKFNENTDSRAKPPQSVSAPQQSSCYAGLNFSYGLNGTGSNYNTDWNAFGQQGGGFGQLGQPQQQSGSAGCMASNMSSTGAANLGVASYTQQTNCLTQAYAVLKGIKGNSTQPNQTARRVAIMYYARCSQDLLEKQSRTFQWTENNLTSFGYVQLYLSEFLRMLAQQNWY